MKNQIYTLDELCIKTKELNKYKKVSSLVASLGVVLVSYSLITSSIKSRPNIRDDSEISIQYNFQKMPSNESNFLERGLLDMEQSIHPISYKKITKRIENKSEDNQTKGIKQILLGLGIMFTGGSFSRYFDKRKEESHQLWVEKILERSDKI